MDVKLFRFGDVEVLDWSGYAGLEGDLAGAQVCLPLRVMFSADTMWLYDIEPDDLPDDSTLATDSISWIDRGNVRFLRGPGERVRQLLDRFLFDTLALEGFERYVRVPMGQGPDGPPEGARRD